jgi:hypothetical protein
MLYNTLPSIRASPEQPNLVNNSHQLALYLLTGGGLAITAP